MVAQPVEVQPVEVQPVVVQPVVDLLVELPMLVPIPDQNVATGPRQDTVLMLCTMCTCPGNVVLLAEQLLE